MHYHAWDMSQGCLGVNGPEITFFSISFTCTHLRTHTLSSANYSQILILIVKTHKVIFIVNHLERFLMNLALVWTWLIWRLFLLFFVFCLIYSQYLLILYFAHIYELALSQNFVVLNLLSSYLISWQLFNLLKLINLNKTNLLKFINLFFIFMTFVHKSIIIRGGM